MLVGRRFDRFHVLHVIRKNKARYRALVACDPYRAIDEMPHLRRDRRHLHVLVRDILEERQEVDFLLVIAAECGALLLADDRHDGLMVGLGVVQAIQKMDGAWPERREAHSDFTGELGMGACHEGGQLFVAGLNELDTGAATAEGTHDAVDAVSGIPEDAPHTPGGEARQEEIADGGGHVSLPAVCVSRLPRPLYPTRCAPAWAVCLRCACVLRRGPLS